MKRRQSTAEDLGQSRRPSPSASTMRESGPHATGIQTPPPSSPIRPGPMEQYIGTTESESGESASSAEEGLQTIRDLLDGLIADLYPDSKFEVKTDFARLMLSFHFGLSSRERPASFASQELLDKWLCEEWDKMAGLLDQMTPRTDLEGVTAKPESLEACIRAQMQQLAANRSIVGVRVISFSKGEPSDCKTMQMKPPRSAVHNDANAEIYVRQIPTTNYLYRVWRSAEPRGTYFLDFLLEDTRTGERTPTNCPEGFELWGGHRANAGGPMRIASVERSCGWPSAEILPGQEKWMLQEGMECALVKAKYKSDEDEEELDGVLTELVTSFEVPPRPEPN